MKTWWFFGYERTTEEGMAADARSFADAGFGGVVYYDQNHATMESIPGVKDPAPSPQILKAAAKEGLEANGVEKRGKMVAKGAEKMELRGKREKAAAERGAASKAAVKGAAKGAVKGAVKEGLEKPAAKGAGERADEGFSPEWWGHLKYAAREAERNGLSFELNISNGYVAGGRWIDPEHAMQRVESAKTTVCVKSSDRNSAAGGSAAGVTIPLPAISGKDGYVKDITVLAFPAERDSLVRHLTAQYAPKGKGRNGAMQVPGPRGEFSGAKWVKRGNMGMLQCSDDSLHWRDVVELEPMYSSQGVYPVRTQAFPATNAKYWRIEYYTDERLRGWSVGPEAMMERWEELSGLQSDFAEKRGVAAVGASVVSEVAADGGKEARGTAADGAAEVSGVVDGGAGGKREVAGGDEGAIDPAAIVDVSRYVGADGILRWDAPEGNWTILRLASVLTGARSKHGRPNLMGYECDKLSVEAATLHWDSYVQVILDSLRADGIRNVSGICMDSHEAGGQNWTPLMLEEFQRRRGYDLRAYLPVLAGYIVGSRQKTEEVLRDFRKTISDCVTENYFGTFQKLCTRERLDFTAQAIGNALCIDGDAIAVKNAVGKPQGEFWAYQQNGAYDIKDCSSAAHLYGKPVASAEAMTDAMYSDTPYTLKRVADIAFSMGAQEFVVCATPHIPEVDPDGPYVAGREYAINRSNPIWDELKPVWEASARSTYMLRQGVAAPDVLVYLGDDIPIKTLTHRLPAGLDDLDWDVCTGDALRTRLRVVPGVQAVPGAQAGRGVLQDRGAQTGRGVLQDRGAQAGGAAGASGEGAPGESAQAGGAAGASGEGAPGEDAVLVTPDGVVYKALIVEEDAFISEESRAVLDSFRAAGVKIVEDGWSIERPLEILDVRDSDAGAAGAGGAAEADGGTAGVGGADGADGADGAAGVGGAVGVGGAAGAGGANGDGGAAGADGGDPIGVADADGIVHTHRIAEGKDIFFIANILDKSRAVSFSIREAGKAVGKMTGKDSSRGVGRASSKGAGKVRVWRTSDGTVKKLSAGRDGKFQLTLAPGESIFITD